jgi:ADP-heptose:LPS heptosyltransferase
MLSADESLPRIIVTDDQRKEGRQILLREGITPDHELLVLLFPGASNAIRRWPAERFAQLADRIAQTYGARILICGAVSDREMEEAVTSRMSAPVSRLAGKTNLLQLASLLSQSALYIGSETGPLHLAAAVGTPTVCILGGGHFGRFYPYGDPRMHRAVFQIMDCFYCNWQCLYEVPYCIRDITVEETWQMVQHVFKEVVLPGRSTPKVGLVERPGLGPSLRQRPIMTASRRLT